MSRPTLTVEVAFATAPTAATPTWVDVTSKVMSISIQRGRQYESDTIQPSTCTIRLDNGDRRFDPTYTQSPYYPNVIPNRKIRVSATWSGTTYRLFTGFVERWPIVWDALAWGSVTVTATDGFSALANARLVMAANLFNNGGFETNTSNWTNTNGSLTRVTTGQQNGSACGKLFADAALTPTTAYPEGGPGALRLGMTAGNYYQINCWLFVPSGLSITLANVLVDFSSNGSPPISGGSTGMTAFDTWQNVVFYGYVGAGATEAYFDIRIAETGASKYVLIDGVNVTQVAPVGASPGIGFDPTQITADGSAAATGIRIGEVLNMAGWSTSERSLDIGSATVGADTIADTDNIAALSHIVDVENSEPGTFFMNGAGQAVFQARTHRYAAASKATFTDAYGSSRLKYSDLQPDMDVTKVLNEVTVTASGSSSPQTVVDTGSQASFFRRTSNLTPLITADSDAYQRAGFEVALHKTPKLRFQQMAILPQGEDALWPQALGLELGDKVTVERSPRTTPSMTSETILKGCFVEQINHTITPSDWQTQFQLSPSDLYDQFWVLGTSLLGTSTVLGY